MPRLLRSPLVPTIVTLPQISLVRCMAKTLIGKRGIRLARRLRTRRSTAEGPTYHANIVADSEGRWHGPTEEPTVHHPAEAGGGSATAGHSRAEP